MSAALNLLVDRLTPTLRSALESAAWQCRSLTHFDVEVEHLLVKLFEDEGGDCPRILDHFHVDRSRLQSDLSAALERLRRGNTRETPGMSPRIGDLLSQGFLHSGLELSSDRIRSGSVLLSLLSGAETNYLARQISREFARIDTDTLSGQFVKITAGSDEATTVAESSTSGGAVGSTRSTSQKGALDRFTMDLTARAREGRLDPVLGRDREVRQMIDVLLRRRQNNPILTGDPGVGKTAVVEGFAARIVAGDVPDALKNVSVRALDLGLLQAGAGVRGEFEERLKGVIAEVIASPVPIVLFIDEAHTLIGAGGAEGQNDAANLLKPPLARGELRTIAATTWSEYKRYFEKDAALARRFQVVKVEEPDETGALAIMRGVAPVLEKHHRVRILPSALDSAVRWTTRYLPDRQLPDKAISVLDTACGRLAVDQASTPAPVSDLRARIAALGAEQVLLVRESATGADHGARLREIAAGLSKAEQDLASIESRWRRESDLVRAILGARERLDPIVSSRGGSNGARLAEAERADLVGQLRRTEEDLRALQGEEPLVRPCVDDQCIAAVLASWTGIPVGRMMADEIETVLDLESYLARRVVGQDSALRTIAHSVRTARAFLRDPGKPIGVFLLLGPSGVGKTESALALTEVLYGGERNLITINMSEFQEAHTVSSLKGSPPGYVGFGQGGVLTEAVRRRPFSVVLLDEMEKAHPDVFELFYQVFDKGSLEDGEGRKIDFKNTLILMTSNLGSQTIEDMCSAGCSPDRDSLSRAVHDEIVGHFKPALVDRMTVVPYVPLSPDVLKRIVELKIDRIRKRLSEQHGTVLEIAPSVVESVLANCRANGTGARSVDHLLEGSMLPEISSRVLRGLAGSGVPRRIEIDVDDVGGFTYRTEAR